MGLTRPIPALTAADLPRRRFIAGAGAAAVYFIARPAMAIVEPDRPRRLCFTNLHTGETCAVEYWADGGYLPAGLDDIAKVLRDHRSGAVHAIDPKLLDLLHKLQGTLETASPFHVISGYRSPASNAKLAAASSGVAKHSMHMDGKAIDIRVPGVDLANLHKAAKILKGGGVGYYAASNFVHMDVGRVRYW
jgi:uncharacterized protein YcbK (DUF882 family)